MTIDASLPDYTSQNATEYKNAIDGSVAINAELGDQFYTTQASTPAMSVSVTGGKSATGVIVPSVTTAITAADATNDRIDLVQVSSNGVVSVKDGTPSASPVQPSPDTDNFALSAVLVEAGVTVIYSDKITDVRSVIGGSGGSGGGESELLVHTLDTATAADKEVCTLSGTSGMGDATEVIGVGISPTKIVTKGVTPLKVVNRTGSAIIAVSKDVFVYRDLLNPNYGQIVENTNISQEYAPSELTPFIGQIATGYSGASVGEGAVLELDVFVDVQKFVDVTDKTKRDIVHGFVDPSGVLFSFDNPTRTCTYSHPSGFVEFWSGKNYYKIANGDARLAVQVSNTNNHDWLYFDVDGQLKYKTSLNWVDVKTVCLGHITKYDPTLGAFILTISRAEDCQANHIENYASYRTKGLQAVRGEGIDFTAAIGDTQTGFTASRYFSARDHEIVGPAINADAVTWLRYHYDGLDSVGDYNTQLTVSPAPTGSPIIIGTDVGLGGTNAIYNIYDEVGDTFTFAECPSNDYVIGHIGFGDGGSQKVVAFAPQGKYSTENEAREAIEGEERRLTNNNDIFRDVAVVASYIVKGNLVGGFLDADGEGNPFYLHSISQQGGGGGGANNQSWDDTLGINNITDKEAIIQTASDFMSLYADHLRFIGATNGTELTDEGLSKLVGFDPLVFSHAFAGNASFEGFTKLLFDGEIIATKQYNATVTGDYAANYLNGNAHVFASPASAYKILAPTNTPSGKACQIVLRIDNATGVEVTDANDAILIRNTDTGIYQVLINILDDGTVDYSSNAPFFGEDVVDTTSDQTIDGEKTFNKASSGETAAQILARGGPALMSVDALTHKTSFNLTAGDADIAITSQTSYYTPVGVHIGRIFTISNNPKVNTNTLFTLSDAGARPSEISYIHCVDTSGEIYTIGISTSGVATVVYKTMPVGTYRISSSDYFL